MKVDGTVSRLAITLSLMLLASLAAAENMANDNTLDPKSLLQSFQNVSLEESCNPNAETNQYIIQFKPNAMGMMESMCQYQWEQGVVNFDFATAKPMVLAAIKKMNDTLNEFGDPSAGPTFLSKTTLEELEKFMDEYASFCLQFQNFMCDQARSFMGALDFMTVSTTYTEPFEVMMEVMGDFVELIEKNQPVQLMKTVELPGLWGLDRIDSLEDTDNGDYTAPGDGTGAHVYIIDTGINSGHVEFAGRIGNGFDFVDNDPDPEDCNGHGTHCAGTALGATYGVAPGATLHGLRVLDCTGSGFSTGTIEGMNWVALNHIKPAVASMSLGGGFSQASTNAVARLYDAGVVVTSAAGNSNDDACNHSPASAPKSYTVGSMTKTEQRSSFSGYGTCVNIFAPGSDIKSAWINSATATNIISGTSMATPHVAGAMAVYLGMYGITKTPLDVTNMLDNVAAMNKITLDGPSATGSPNKLLQITFPLSCTPVDGVPNTNCVVSEWTAFGAGSLGTCSAPCGPGTQTRTRTITTAKVGCGSCFEENSLSQTQPCQLTMCPQAEPTFFGAASAATFFSYKTITYTPTTATEYTMTSNCPAASLPFATANHPTVTMGDEASLTFPFGSSFKFFGVDYPQASLCSNGYIYFTGGTCGYQFSTAGHFSEKRISFAGVDLNPGSGGVITSSGGLLSDRIVITFAAVPLYNTDPSVTAQVEMIHSGSEAGVIRMTWGYLLPDNNRQLAIGLSSGSGSVPVGYSSLTLPDLPTTCSGAPDVTTQAPTSSPTTASPTAAPTASPTTASPSQAPSAAPTSSPTTAPPTASPTTKAPTAAAAVPTTAAPTTASPTSSPATFSPTTPSPTASPASTPTTVPTPPPVVPTPGDLADLDSTPAMQFPLPGGNSTRRRTLLQVATNRDSGLYGAGAVKGADAIQSAGDEITMKATLEGKRFSFFPTQRVDIAHSTWDYRVSCVETLADGGFMDDTRAAWNNIRLRDDDSKVINLSNEFRFGGLGHKAIFIGSNGFLTIGSRRTTNSPSIFNHYSAAYSQISTAFTDLNPSVGGGTVKWIDNTNHTMTGSFTVSFNNVPEYGNNNNRYSFQVTVHQSGKIDMSYKLVPDSANSAVVGISVGKFPREFVNRDFTAASDATVNCASQPVLAVAIPVTMRAPTQEFSTGAAGSGRRLLALSGDRELTTEAGKGESVSLLAAADGGNLFDLESTTLTFAPLPSVGGEDVLGYSVACVDTGITQLPRADTSTATDMSLGDDDSQRVSFTDSKLFTFFGTNYSSVWIGSNGFLTFGSADTSNSPHRYWHFLKPRISALFTDLNPAAGASGTVHYEQTADSFFVTFTDIKTYSGNNFFTFQYELNFDVTAAGATQLQPFRISYTRFTPMSARAIVGVSAGGLYSTTNYQDFEQWDLKNAATSCAASTASSGILSVQSAGVEYGVQAAAAAESTGAPEFCPMNIFNVSFTTRAAPTVAAVVVETSSPPPQNAASRPIPMVATLVVCIAALMFGTVV
eukprot:CAMPEP_0198198764 /NCGR_PEP_ID=MMETSP1445-20131203/2161_1 /TAXON_ID=36898 /ORGANISM="Pyramimonas sp., Strain CCMP2087" /LENGTH=1504 /DNA_ID=CAMNT_0043868401 /DNA_START=138 /DNA_END=4652 /DNA_ORIENTATION=+